MKSLKFSGCSGVSLSHGLAIRPAIVVVGCRIATLHAGILLQDMTILFRSAVSDWNS